MILGNTLGGIPPKPQTASLLNTEGLIFAVPCELWSGNNFVQESCSPKYRVKAIVHFRVGVCCATVFVCLVNQTLDLCYSAVISGTSIE